MGEKEPVSWAPLTEEQWALVPNADHTTLFTHEEVLAALQQLMPADEATAVANDLYNDVREPGIFFYGELLTVLSSLSESAAERVRAITTDPAGGAPRGTL